MWLTPGRVSCRVKRCSQTLHDCNTKRGHCTDRSTVLVALPYMVKDKSGKLGPTGVGFNPINDGEQPDVLQQCRALMASQRSKSQDVRAATWNVSSMVCRSGVVVDAPGRRKIYLC